MSETKIINGRPVVYPDGEAKKDKPKDKPKEKSK
jgi:hypothetical protein